MYTEFKQHQVRLLYSIHVSEMDGLIGSFKTCGDIYMYVAGELNIRQNFQRRQHID